MFSGQFALAGQHSGEQDPVLLYAVETALQLHIAELTEPLRELYVMAYSLPSIAAYLYKSTTKRLQVIFGPYLPEAQPKDFYEMEIASANIMRGFMSVPCDVYFTMEAKISRFLDCSLKLYDVPKEKRAAITATVLQMDLHTMALGIIQKTVRQAEKGFEALTEKNKFWARDIPLVHPMDAPYHFHHGGITMRKRLLSILTALTLCLTLLPTAAFAAATIPDVWDGSTAAKLTGSGTSEDDPFLISTGAELKLLAENSRILDFGSCYVKLTNDIILNDGTFEKDGSFTKNGEGSPSEPKAWLPAGKATWHIDGNGHYISGLYIKLNEDRIGLFSYTDNGGYVKRSYH